VYAVELDVAAEQVRRREGRREPEDRDAARRRDVEAVEAQRQVAPHEAVQVLDARVVGHVRDEARGPRVVVPRVRGVRQPQGVAGRDGRRRVPEGHGVGRRAVRQVDRERERAVGRAEHRRARDDVERVQLGEDLAVRRVPADVARLLAAHRQPERAGHVARVGHRRHVHDRVDVRRRVASRRRP